MVANRLPEFTGNMQLNELKWPRFVLDALPVRHGHDAPSCVDEQAMIIY
jgi:hypothetical protein